MLTKTLWRKKFSAADCELRIHFLTSCSSRMHRCLKAGPSRNGTVPLSQCKMQAGVCGTHPVRTGLPGHRKLETMLRSLCRGGRLLSSAAQPAVRVNQRSSMTIAVQAAAATSLKSLEVR